MGTTKTRAAVKPAPVKMAKPERSTGPSPAWQLYEKALRGRKRKSQAARRQACENGWLAVAMAVDEWLATKGFVVPKDPSEEHAMRYAYLADLAMVDENGRAIAKLVPEISEILHGLCFFAHTDTPFADTLLATTVREVLVRTGQAPPT